MDSYYGEVIDDFENKAIANSLDFAQGSKLLNESNFGVTNIFLRNFKSLGWEASAIVFNSYWLQKSWMKENRKSPSSKFAWVLGNRIINKPYFSWILPYFGGMHSILLRQVSQSRPDVIIVNDVTTVPRSVLLKIKRRCNFVVAHHSSALPEYVPLADYDAVISSVPKVLEAAKVAGAKTLHFLPGFDSEMSKYATNSRDIDCCFVGSVYPGTVDLLIAAKKVFSNLQIYSSHCTLELRQANLASNWVGPAWGEEMFKVLGRSKIVLNRHGVVAKEFAANMRLFEATGMGAALVTDWKPDLVTLFRENEVASYQTLEDLVAVLSRLSNSPSEVQSLGAAGQKRTLNSHTYSQRVEILSDFLKIELMKKVPK